MIPEQVYILHQLKIGLENTFFILVVLM